MPSVKLKCVTTRSFIPMGLQFHPCGTAVPSLRDCSFISTGLQFHPYGTAVPSPRDCSLSHKRLGSPGCVAPRQRCFLLSCKAQMRHPWGQYRGDALDLINKRSDNFCRCAISLTEPRPAATACRSHRGEAPEGSSLFRPGVEARSAEDPGKDDLVNDIRPRQGVALR